MVRAAIIDWFTFTGNTPVLEAIPSAEGGHAGKKTATADNLESR